jgi:hypothetical protein
LAGTEIEHAAEVSLDLDGLHVANPTTAIASSHVLSCRMREHAGSQWRLTLDLDWAGSSAGIVVS